ncbi:caspase family protein [Streptomyces xylophagus]|uniref:caspase family protein n=1 Tax=Streptomyces xylophagus TaxID=285514 RepID=UPI000D120FA7|nr:caspase family protein [Streptomyces xylophagus]
MKRALPEPRKSRVVLIGTSKYESTDLEDVPAIERNLSSLKQFLTSEEGGIVPTENCTVIENPKSQAVVGEGIARAADAAEDLLLIYYSGHGLLSSARHELFLGMQGTATGSHLPFTAVDFSHVRDACLGSSARSRVLILDCCYSGRAIPGTLSAGSTSSLFLNQVQVSGTYTLTASPANSVAKVYPGALHTVFTGELLRVLRDGVPGGEEMLTLGTLYRALHASLRESGNPVPQQCNTALAESIAIGRNYAFDLSSKSATYELRDSASGSGVSGEVPLSFATFTPGRTVEVPKVPRSQAERSKLMVERPHSWEYLLYASSLYLGLRSLDGKWRQYEEGRGENSRRMSVAQLCRYLDDSIGELQKIISEIDECLSQELQDQAFEPTTGQENPDLIMRMASRLVGVLEDLLGWAMAIRGIESHRKAGKLIKSAASLADLPARQVRAFIEEYIKETDDLNRQYAESETGSVSVHLTLKLEIDQAAIDDFLGERTRLN